MWKVLWLTLMTFTIGNCFDNVTFPVMDIVKILRRVSTADVSPTCQDHLDKYLEGIINGEFWALQMADSITKFPDGVLIGHILILGNFDECIEVVHDENLFKGKYCMTSAKVTLPDIIKVPKYLLDKSSKQNSLRFSYAICVPSTCSPEDIKTAVENVPELNFIDIKIDEKDCSTNDFRSLRTEDWITISIIICTILIAVASTIYDYIQRKVHKNESLNQLWSSFSILKNGELLFKVSQNTAQLKCLHGIRFFSICWVVLGHTYFQYLFARPVNLKDVEIIMKETSFIPVGNAFVSVDSFFFLSGLLVCLVFFRDIAKKGWYDVPVAFIHRYLRLTPPFLILIIIQATIISRIGNGPLWNSRMDATESACRESWWTGILYVQNYVEPFKMCLGQSWYLSADMQMYWISPLILYPVLLFPVYAPYLILLLVLVAISVNFTVGYVNELGPNFGLDFGPSTQKQFEIEYSPFHTRMSPWLIGLATGYIICGIQAKKIRLNLPWYGVLAGWLAAFGLLGGSLFGISSFLKEDYTQFEASFYLAFHRVGWALGLSWTVIACVAGFGGPINWFLSLDMFQPLAKLSYCNFLIHMTIQSYRMNTARMNQYVRHFDIIYGYFGDLVMSNLVAIPLVLLFEFPFTHIDRHFFQKLVIFPFPKPKTVMEEKPREIIEDKPKEIVEDKPKEIIEEKKDTISTSLDDVEGGEVNSAFTKE